MSSFKSIRFLTRAALVVSTLAAVACSNPGSPNAAIPTTVSAVANGAHRQSRAAGFAPLTASPTETLYVGDETGYVDVYNGTGTLQGPLADGIDNPAWSMTVDPVSGSLYVANSLCCVTAYKAGTVIPAGVYDIEGYGEFACCSIANGNKKMYVGYSNGCWSLPDCHDASDQNNGVVLVYPLLQRPEGRSKPLTIIKTPTGTHVNALAVDAKDNLYIEYAQNVSAWPIAAHIEEISPGAKTPKKLKIELGNGSPSLALDSKGDLIACDEVPGTIDIFSPRASKPTRTISSGLANCGFFALSSDEKTLYASNEPITQVSPGHPAVVTVYNYATGKPEMTISAGLNPTTSVIDALAVSPAAPLGQPY